MARRATNSRAARTSCAFETLEGRKLMSAGSLDATFLSAGGPGAHFVGTAHAVAVQGDGKTVVVGDTRVDIAHNHSHFIIERFNVNGTLDLSFGSGGSMNTVIGGTGDYQSSATAVAIQANGRILVAGYSRIYDKDLGGYDVYLAVARYLPTGQLDRSFSSDSFNTGYVMTDLGTDGITTSPSAQGSAITIQNDGKILVAGTATPATLTNVNQDMFVARFNVDGTTDDSFGDSGVRFIGFGNNERANAVAVDYTGTQATNSHYGTIVVAGNTSDSHGSNIAVARLTPGGDFDSSFNSIGRREFIYNGFSSNATGVVIEPGSKIVVAGSVNTSNPGDTSYIALERFLPNGETDTTFGFRHNGTAITRINGNDHANDIVRSYDGGLIVGGTSKNEFAIAKYSADGVLDSHFGNNGTTVTPIDTSIARLAPTFGHRFMAVGGSTVARFLDTDANQINFNVMDSNAYEKGKDPASFVVSRSESLPWPTRVYFKVGGTATSPLVKMPGSHADYTGISTPPLLASYGNGPSSSYFGQNVGYVDIPAYQTGAIVTITPIADTRTEGTETADFTLLSNVNYEMGSNTAITLSIYDTPAFKPLAAMGVTRSVHSKLLDGVFSDTAVVAA